MNSLLGAVKESKRLELTVLLSILSAFCLLLSLFRVFLSGTGKYLFLNWNLFLAAVPWILSSTVTMHESIRWKKSVFWGVLFVWLLFFPNAPYILTDLFHLKSESNMPAWFDLALILSFSWTGLAFGFTSLRDIEHLLKRRMSGKWTDTLIVAILFLVAFGVTLGRFQRWNSWDLIRDPAGLLQDVGDRLLHPSAHGRTWGMTILTGALLNMMYWTLRFLKKHYYPS